MSIQKIKTEGQLRSKYNHNYRIVTVDNADPSKLHLNEELVPLPFSNDGKQKDFNEMFKDRITSISAFSSRKIRKDAVRALEIITTFSRNDSLDLERWKEKNVEWLQKTFNIAGDKKDNVISVMYHGDEAGNVHCHAIIIPIDEKCHLNASRFIDGSRVLGSMQTDYANAMKEFGLERGLEGSSAKHEDIRRFYTQLNRSLDIPTPHKLESAKDYYQRVKTDIENANLQLLARQKESERNFRRKLDIQKQQFKQALKEELLSIEHARKYITNSLSSELDNLYSEKEQVKGNILMMNQAYGKLESQFESLSKENDRLTHEKNSMQLNLDEIRKKTAFYDRFTLGFKQLSEYYPDKALELSSTISIMDNLYQQQLEPELSVPYLEQHDEY